MNRSLTFRILLTGFLFGIIQGVSAQDPVSVHIKPDSASYRVATLPSSNSHLATAVEIPYDSEQENIWKWFELIDTFEGHVRKTYVTKGLAVQVGTPVYFVPGDENTFLTILEDSANAEVIEASGDWVKIYINASLPVYFETDQQAAATIVKNPQPVVSTSEGRPYEAEPAIAYDDPINEPIDLDPSVPYPGEPIDRILEGQLRQYRPSFFNPFKKPAYGWEILNRRKKRIAFIDPANLIMDRPLESYEGRMVSLTGSIYQIKKGRDLVIVAKQITPL